MRRDARLTHADPSFYGMIIRSGDQGDTWSDHPEVIGGYEYYGMDDPGITQLSDGRILVNAFRRSFAPAASVDSRKSWNIEREIVLRDDLKNRDLGYPTTTQLDDGTLLTAYYGRDENNDVTCIQITSWKIAS